MSERDFDDDGNYFDDHRDHSSADSAAERDRRDWERAQRDTRYEEEVRGKRGH